ncbi:MAG: alpha/beta hydrolase [Polyangiaceae bacterium]
MFLRVGGKRLEARTIAARASGAPTLVFLHEGLGSVSAWKDVPDQLAEATGFGALVYSRAGYGASDPVTLPRPLDYMVPEGEVVLPEVLAAAGVERAVLVGHSDGASIAIVHAGSAPRPGLLGMVLEAPHVICEDRSVAAIALAREAYRDSDLREKLARHHGDNVDLAFRGWNDAWLDPGFRAMDLVPWAERARVPALLVQERDDPYGTTAQITLLERALGARAETLLLDGDGHAPHKDLPEVVLPAIATFALGVAGMKDR